MTKKETQGTSANRHERQPYQVRLPGFISDAGLFHDAGVSLPRWVRTKRPEDVADAVIGAIERDRVEVDVAPLSLRAGALFASVAPGLSATVQRRLGAGQIAEQYERGQRDKRA